MLEANKFKALKIAYECGKQGGTMPVCMNAANEEAVFAFLKGKIRLYDIVNLTEKMLEKHTLIKTPTLDEIFAIDEEVRIKTRELF